MDTEKHTKNEWQKLWDAKKREVNKKWNDEFWEEIVTCAGECQKL